MMYFISVDPENYHTESITANIYEVIRVSLEYIQIEMLGNEQ